MHTSSTVISTLVGIAALCSGQSVITCDGSRAPDWDDCAILAQRFRDNSADYVPNYYPDCTYATPPGGTDKDSLNCEVYVCYDSASDLEVGIGVAGIYDTIRVGCAGQMAGGSDSYNGANVFVYNNGGFEPSEQTQLTLEEGIEARDHARQFPKRQADGDTDYTLVVKANSVEGSGKRLTGDLPTGSKFTVTQENSQTVGIESTVEIGGSFFEIFSASVSLSVSADFTTSNSVGVSVNVDCGEGNYGQVYWYPLFTRYEGFYSPSNTNADFYVPEDSSASTYNYRVVCLT